MLSNDNVTFRSADWTYLVGYLQDSLKKARDILENKETSPEDTTHYRGRIALAKEILNLPDIAQQFPANKTK